MARGSVTPMQAATTTGSRVRPERRADVVCAVATVTQRGGIASATLNVLQALATLTSVHDGRLSVLSVLDPSDDRPAFLPRSVRFRGCEGSRLTYVTSILRAAADRPLLCFDHVRLALPVLPLAAAGLARTVIFAHGSEAWSRVRPTSRWSFRAATLCLTNSEFTLRKMREHLGRFHGAACPLGLSPEFSLNADVPGDATTPIDLAAVDGRPHRLGDRVLLMVARMHPTEGGKGHDLLIEALPELLREFPDVQLVCPGPGAARAARAERARRIGVGSSVFMPGEVSTETLAALYQRSYAFVMPSRQEGFGLVYLEAMNYARPCLGVRDQGAEDVIVDGETGILLRNPDDRAELLGALRGLLQDPAEARRLGRAGFRRLHATFTAAHHQARVCRLLETVLR